MSDTVCGFKWLAKDETYRCARQDAHRGPHANATQNSFYVSRDDLAQTESPFRYQIRAARIGYWMRLLVNGTPRFGLRWMPTLKAAHAARQGMKGPYA